MIQATDIHKTFRDSKRGDVKAVDGITLTCNPGEIYGLLGPNGAGKTTLMRMLATILAPTAGSAVVAGYDVQAEPTRVRASIGYLSGGTALYERMTPREMVRYFGALYGLTTAKVESRIRTVFGDLEIDEFADSRCDKLSTGQRQRVSIARTILHEPPVLIFDEPTNGLDILASRTIVRFIRRCRDEGRTVIFSTHILSEVESLCDRIGVVYHGKLVGEGTMFDLRAQTGKQTLEEVFLNMIGEVV
jgi:sodium transport system ATP-binding protein